MLVAPWPARPPSSKAAACASAILADISNFDPQQFLTINFPLIKNIYDSLIEYTPDGKAVPSLATAWKIAPDNTSVTLTLRKDVKFHSGTPFNAAGGGRHPEEGAPIRRRARTSTPPCPS